METVRNYLETMFANLPNTTEVKRAKYELGQMMEDKYMELKAEGKSENEAVGVVISEFGNLDELANDLGIGVYLNRQNMTEQRVVTLQEVKEYISDKTRFGLMIGLGVLLCIISPCGVIITGGDRAAYGLVFMFTAVTIAVVLFVFSGVSGGKWDFLKHGGVSVSFSTMEYIHNEKEHYRMTNALMNSIGVGLCIFCVVPVIVTSEIGIFGRLENISVALMFILVAGGVFFFVATGNKMASYNTLLKINNADTIGGNFVQSQRDRVQYGNPSVAAIMSVYWPTVTCIYLCISFLSGYWHITWIIWIVAKICHTFIESANRG